MAGLGSRLLRLLLSVTLVVGLMPSWAFATTGDECTEEALQAEETTLQESSQQEDAVLTEAGEGDQGLSGEPDEAESSAESDQLIGEGGDAIVSDGIDAPDDETPVVKSKVYVEQDNPLTGGTGEVKTTVIDPSVSELSASDTYKDAVAATVTYDEAVKAVKEAMANRDESFTVVVKATDDYDGNISVEIFYEALEEDGDPSHGDYLRWIHEGMGCGVTKWSDGTTVCEYTVGYKTTAAQESEFAAEVSSALSGLGLSGKSDYEKTLAIYDYICANVVYDYDNLNDDTHRLKYTAYAALLNGTSVCQGYASLFYYMAVEAGLSVRMVAGTSNGEAHSWNIVQLDDGLYYNLDATWDAACYQAGEDFEYFLKSDADFEGHVRGTSGGSISVDYGSDEFLAAYPMAEASYAPEAGEDEGDSLGFTYAVVNGEATITGYSGSETDLIIPSEIDGYPVTSIGDCAFSLNEIIESVTILEGVAAIEDHAFVNCVNLESAFIPSSVSSIGEEAFHGCLSLESVELSVGLSFIGYEAFSACSSLRSVVIPEGVATISAAAFYGCTSLESIDLPESITSIEGQTFRECTSLKSISIPSGVTAVEPYAFIGCSALERFEVETGNQMYASHEGVLFTADMKTLVSYPGGAEGDFVVPDGVETIGDWAFWSDDMEYAVESVIIPEGVVSIGVGAFGCRSLKSVAIPSSVSFIGNVAFTGLAEGSTITVYSQEQYDLLTGGDYCYNPDLTSIVLKSENNIAYASQCIYQDCLYDDEAGRFTFRHEGSDFVPNVVLQNTSTWEDYVQGVHYSVKCMDASGAECPDGVSEPGVYTLVFTGVAANGYGGQQELEFEYLAANDIRGCYMGWSGSCVIDDGVFKPFDYSIWTDDETLVEGEDYCITGYRSETADATEEWSSEPPTVPGNYYMKICGMGDYTGARSHWFALYDAKSLDLADVEEYEIEWGSGKPISFADLNVRAYDGTVLVEGRDVEVVNWYANGEPLGADNPPSDPGYYSVEIAPAEGSEYTTFWGTAWISFELWDRYDISSYSVSISGGFYSSYSDYRPQFLYTGEPIDPDFYVSRWVSDTVIELTEGIDYEVSYSDSVGSPNEDVNVTVTIRGIGEYVGEVTEELLISPTINLSVLKENGAIGLSHAKEKYTWSNWSSEPVEFFYTGYDMYPFVSIDAWDMPVAPSYLEDYDIVYQDAEGNVTIPRNVGDYVAVVSARDGGILSGEIEIPFSIVETKGLSGAVFVYPLGFGWSQPDESYFEVDSFEDTQWYLQLANSAESLVEGVDFVVSTVLDTEADTGAKVESIYSVLISGIGRYAGEALECTVAVRSPEGRFAADGLNFNGVWYDARFEDSQLPSVYLDSRGVVVEPVIQMRFGLVYGVDAIYGGLFDADGNAVESPQLGEQYFAKIIGLGEYQDLERLVPVVASSNEAVDLSNRANANINVANGYSINSAQGGWALLKGLSPSVYVSLYHQYALVGEGQGCDISIDPSEDGSSATIIAVGDESLGYTGTVSSEITYVDKYDIETMIDVIRINESHVLYPNRVQSVYLDYHGFDYFPSVDIQYYRNWNYQGSGSLVEGADYKVTLLDEDGGEVEVITGDGKYALIIEGVGDWAGSWEVSLNVSHSDDPANIENCSMVVAGGAEKALLKDGVAEPSVSLAYGDYELIEGEDYVLEYGNNTEPGVAYVTATAGSSGRFHGSLSASFNVYDSLNLKYVAKVLCKQSDDLWVELGGAYYMPTASLFDGVAEPEIRVVVDIDGNENGASGVVLDSQYYDVTYSDNTQPGVASVEVTGKNGYTGTVYGNFIVANDSSFADATDSDFTYTISNGEITITGYRGSEVDLVIPSEMYGCPVVEIGQSAFYGCDSLQSVVLPDGLKTLGYSAFYGCESLKSVTIPGSVTEIDTNVFSSCESLETVELGEGLEYVSFGMFSDCTSLSEIDLPSTLTAIYGHAFSGSSLVSVEVPEGVTTIGSGAFSGTMLESFAVPKSATSVDGFAFSGCSSLKYFEVSEGNTAYSAVDGVLFTADGSTLVSYPGGKAKKYAVPEGTKIIGESSFCAANGSSIIESVSIPEGVTTIGAQAFDECASLVNVSVPTTVTSISSFAFTGLAEGSTITVYSQDQYDLLISEENCYNTDLTTIVLKSENNIASAPHYISNYYGMYDEGLGAYVFSYGGAGFTPKVVLYDPYTGEDYRQGVQYSVKCVDPDGNVCPDGASDPGRYTLVLTGIAANGYAGCQEIDFEYLEEGDISRFDCWLENRVVLEDGVLSKLAFCLGNPSDGSLSLKEGTDYYVAGYKQELSGVGEWSTAAPSSAGYYYAKICGMGDYFGEIETGFWVYDSKDIVLADIKTFEVEHPSGEPVSFDDLNILAYDGSKLIEGRDVEVVEWYGGEALGADNPPSEPGYYTVVFTAAEDGEYVSNHGDCWISFALYDLGNLSSYNIDLQGGLYTMQTNGLRTFLYTGEPVEPISKVGRYTANGYFELTQGVDYSVSYVAHIGSSDGAELSPNGNVGLPNEDVYVEAVINGLNDFEGQSTSLWFAIVPAIDLSGWTGARDIYVSYGLEKYCWSSWADSDVKFFHTGSALYPTVTFDSGDTGVYPKYLQDYTVVYQDEEGNPVIPCSAGNYVITLSACEGGILTGEVEIPFAIVETKTFEEVLGYGGVYPFGTDYEYAGDQAYLVDSVEDLRWDLHSFGGYLVEGVDYLVSTMVKPGSDDSYSVEIVGIGRYIGDVLEYSVTVRTPEDKFAYSGVTIANVWYSEQYSDGRDLPVIYLDGEGYVVEPNIQMDFAGSYGVDYTFGGLFDADGNAVEKPEIGERYYAKIMGLGVYEGCEKDVPVTIGGQELIDISDPSVAGLRIANGVLSDFMSNDPSKSLDWALLKDSIPSVSLQLYYQWAQVYDGQGVDTYVEVDNNGLAATVTAVGLEEYGYTGSASVKVNLVDTYNIETMLDEIYINGEDSAYDINSKSEVLLRYYGFDYRPSVLLSSYSDWARGDLVEGVDYSVTLLDQDENVVEAIASAGYYTLIVEGIGNWSGTIGVPLNVVELDGSANLEECTMLVAGGSGVSLIQDGTACPEISLSFGAYELVEGEDYVLEYGNNTEPGRAYVTATPGPSGKFHGSISKHFEAYETLDIEDHAVLRYQHNNGQWVTFSSYTKPTMTLSGNAVEPEVMVTLYAIGTRDSLSTAVIDPQYYDVEYGNNDKPGIAWVKVTGKNGYEGTISANFLVVEPRGTILDEESGFCYSLSDDVAAIEGYVGELRDITIPTEIGGYPVASIADGAFRGTSLDLIRIPAGISSFGRGAFVNMPEGSMILVSAEEQRNLLIGENPSIYVSPDRTSVCVATYEPVATLGLVYTGSEQAGVAADEGYEVSGGSAVDAGSYEAVAKLLEGYAWADGTTADKVIPWSIAKAEYDMTGVSFDDAVVTYDGAPRFIEVSGGLPAGVSVSYEGNGATNVGSYRVSASFSGDANHEAIPGMTATLVIEPAVLTATYVDERVAWGEVPGLAVSVEGFQGNDNAANALGYVAPVVESPSSVKPGASYELAPAGGSAANYTFSYVAGVLTVGLIPVVAPASIEGLIYTGSELVGVEAGEGYELSGKTAATDIGSYEAVAKLLPDYMWEDGSTDDLTIPWSILPIPISSAEAASIGSQFYVGSAIEPEVSLTYNGETLVEDIDYTVSYEDNVVPGTANVVVKGMGIFGGTLLVPFKIARAQGDELALPGSWREDSNGRWYANYDGTYPASCWQVINGKRYRFSSSGYLVTGWFLLNGGWYWLGSDGAMRTDWQNIGSSTYYLGPNGVMRTGWQDVGSSRYYFGGDGAMRTGWQGIGSSTYYLGSDGIMRTGWQDVGSSKYYLGSSGAMATGWMQADGVWYYFSSGGSMATGWLQTGGVWYWFAGDGAMATGWQEIGSSDYYFSDSGAMRTGWVEVDGSRYYLGGSGAVTTGWVQSGGSWYWLDPAQDGSMSTGWQEIDGSRYYFRASGTMAIGWLQSDGVWYWFAGDGSMATGWLQTGGVWYWFAGDGAMATGWQEIGSSDYYFSDSGAMRTGWVEVDGSRYYLGGSGAVTTGWVQSGGSWYWLDPAQDGSMSTGWQEIDGSRYYFRASGTMATGWVQTDGDWYYLSGGGNMLRSTWVGNYYVLDDGKMAVSQWVDGGRYYVGPDGLWIAGYVGVA